MRSAYEEFDPRFLEIARVSNPEDDYEEEDDAPQDLVDNEPDAVVDDCVSFSYMAFRRRGSAGARSRTARKTEVELPATSAFS